jgi:thiol-disulfide isomerase/thioredoxin
LSFRKRLLVSRAVYSPEKREELVRQSARRHLALIVSVAMFVPGASLRVARGADVTDVHKAILQGKDWLNVERPPTAEELSGRIILLDFWTFCCINCMHIIPDLKVLEKEFGSSLTVIGVHSPKFANEHETGNIRNAILRYELVHPVTNDPDYLIWKSFQVNCWPQLVLINPKGEVAAVYRGEGHLAELERDITRLKKDFAGTIKTDPLPISLEKDKLAPSPLEFPGKLAYAQDLGLLFVSDSNHERILSLHLDGEVVDSIGRKDEPGNNDGSFEEAQFRRPQGLLYADGVLYVADTENHLLRKIDFSTRKVMTFAGTGKQGGRSPHEAPALTTALSSPWDLTLEQGGKRILIAMAGVHQIWAYDKESATVSLVAGSGKEAIVDGTLPQNALAQTSGLSVMGDKLYFVDSETSSLRVLSGGEVTSLLGKGLFDFGLKDGPKETARLQHPLGVFADPEGIFIADSYNHAIRRYDLDSRTIETLAGSGKAGFADGSFAEARFDEPAGILKLGEKLYVSDTNNHRIRVLDLEKKQVSTLVVTEKAPSKPSHEKPSESLPLLEKGDDASVPAGKEIVLRVTVAKGFHLSPDAPSWLAVYSAGPDGSYTLTREVDSLDALARDVHLPARASGESYRVQGTFSYCKDGVGSEAVCLTKSFDRRLVASPSGQETTIELSLSGP